MRVQDRQQRANVALSKPLTTHLTRDKGDFLCRVHLPLLCDNFVSSYVQSSMAHNVQAPNFYLRAAQGQVPHNTRISGDFLRSFLWFCFKSSFLAFLDPSVL